MYTKWVWGRVGKSLLVVAGAVFVLSLPVQAQTLIPPRWSIGPWVSGNFPVANVDLSGAGPAFVTWNSKSFQVQTLTDPNAFASTTIYFPVAQESINSSDTLTGIGFYPEPVSPPYPNMTKLVYALNSGPIYTFDYSNFTEVKLPIVLPAGHGARLLKTTWDSGGNKLAFVTTDPVTLKDEICVYSLDEKTFLAKFDSQNGTTASVDFLGDSTIVASGPTLYDYTGKVLHMVPNGSNPQPVLISPQSTGTELFSISSGQNDMVSAYDTNLSELWSVPVPADSSGNTMEMGENGLILPGLIYNSTEAVYQWTVTTLSTADGSNRGTTAYPAKAAVMPELFLNYIGTGNGALWEQPGSYNFQVPQIATSALGVQGRAAFSLFGLGKIEYWVDITINGDTFTGWQGAPSLVTDEVVFDSAGNPSGSKFVARSFDTGQPTNVIIQPRETPNSIASPAGDYVAVADGTLSVYSEETQDLVASYAGVTGPFAWGGSNIIANFHGASVFAFNGASLKLLHTFPFLNTSKATYELSPDGTRVAMFDAAGGVQVFNSSSGALIGTVPGDQFSKVTAFYLVNGYIGIQIVRSKSAGDSVNFNSFYVFADSGGALAPTVSVGYAIPSDPREGGHYGGGFSQDGKYFVIASQAADPAFPTFAGSSIRVYRASDGVLMNRWDNQLLPDFSSGYQIFSFGLDDLNLIWMTGGGYYAAAIGAQATALYITGSYTKGYAGLVTMTNPAPAGGEVLKVSTTGAGVNLPATITVPAGVSQYNFPIPFHESNATTNNTVTLTDIFGNQVQTEFSIYAPAVASVVPSVTSVIGGQSFTLTVTLSRPGVSPGITVALASNNAAASVPATVLIPAGQTSKTVTVTTKALSSATTVTLEGFLSPSGVTTTVTIKP